MEHDKEFICRCDEGIDGEPIYRKVRIRHISAQKSYKITDAERQVIWSFCEERAVEVAFVYLLKRAEDRYQEYQKTRFADFNMAARYTPITRNLLREWLKEFQKPGLFGA